MKRTRGMLALLAGLSLGLTGASAWAADRCVVACEEDATACQDICKQYKGKKSVVLQKCLKLCSDAKQTCLEGCESSGAKTPPAPAPAQAPTPGAAPKSTPGGGGAK
ncbi:hypothetical protein [Pyxidicoccus trucidator]|uniref:hypothetical protein n=1 Tax=Pyxidicoccus trucidator TaxID=2709662 RepID=UPI0013DBD7F1|nr:hypothetical protein [Pyxidicoccus trucidator]